DGKLPDQGDADIDQRQHYRLPILQKQEHDEGHQDDRVAQRVENFIHRFANEGRDIIDDGVVQLVGKPRLQFAHAGAYAIGRVERVRRGELKDRHADRWFAVEPRQRRLAAGAEFRAADVAQVGDLAVVAGLEDN